MQALGPVLLKVGGWLSRIASLPFDKLSNQHKQTALILPTWHDPTVRGVISRAMRSVVILDSYFSEAAWLASILPRTPKNNTGRLTVTLYICSRDGLFGAQRVAEHSGKSRPIPDLRTYQKKFDEWLVDLQTLVGELPNIDLEVYEYETMPELRLFVVDDTQFVYGYFPAHTTNPWHPCQYVHRSVLPGTRSLLIDHLYQHVRKVKGSMRLRYSTCRTELGTLERRPPVGVKKGEKDKTKAKIS
jgi:hypothetical protein